VIENREFIEATIPESWTHTMRPRANLVAIAADKQAFQQRFRVWSLAWNGPHFGAIAIEPQHVAVGYECHMLPVTPRQHLPQIVHANKNLLVAMDPNVRSQTQSVAHSEEELATIRVRPIVNNRCPVPT
jgi:hypothetical protein